ncbi:MAG: beta-ketoacyl synthase [Bacteroidales bacterium]|jgi:3-oxoacyl-[acyl-carrier-protein] synthase-1|nr:beta-ketoacyl synthase [Bacteroidales bacterium]
MSVYIESGNIISPLGFSTEENYANILSGRSGLRLHTDSRLSDVPLQLALIDDALLESTFAAVVGDGSGFTRFEKFCLLTVTCLLKNSSIDISSPDTVIILSTTKGNIELLESYDSRRLHLWHSAALIAKHFSAYNKPLIISNACVSGVAALVVARRLIESGKYNNAVVVGADIISRFIVSGFQSFMSLSPEPCKPFDAKRVGLNLGEAAVSAVLTRTKLGGAEQQIEVVRGAMHNDANHISGPSRTGEGLFHAIKDALAGDKVDFISAHGTATAYNDNMEAVAISRAGLNKVPVNSVKGFFGHTLGAAGLLEAIIALEAMKDNRLIGTRGYSEHGVSEAINVIKDTGRHEVNSLLKLASGFGGSNAAVLLRKTR